MAAQQAFAIRRWCPLCLGVSGVVALQLVLAYANSALSDLGRLGALEGAVLVGAGLSGALLDGVNGRCQPFGYGCSYDECFRDEDCAPDELCDCAGGEVGAHRCLPAECRVDADCPRCATCSPSRDALCPNATDVVGYFCHTPNDQCRKQEDCVRGTCAYDKTEARWLCISAICEVP